MTVLRVILSHQLSLTLRSLEEADRGQDVIFMCECMHELTHVPHHPKKIAFMLASMRHFAQELTQQGYRVHYVKLDDPTNTGTWDGEITRAVESIKPNRLILTEPGDWQTLQLFKQLQKTLPIPLDIYEDDRFLCSLEDFKKWAGFKRQLRMEFFYREMRRRYNILMEPHGDPVGGSWNYDSANRKPPCEGMKSPSRLSHPKDSIIREVLTCVEERFSNHFGALKPFHFALTRKQALLEARHFIANLLPYFGDYQDAMVAGEAYLYHSLLSAYLNAGLLLPLELCQMAQEAYHLGKAPLNACEGFIRQILGWREYVRGIYWLFMPDYGQRNYFNAKRPLPALYWGESTSMFCMAEAVRHTKEHAYSHHTQRLMVTGNFALIAGLDPQEVGLWYLSVYADAYEWVEMPNTLGMALFGDGGLMASKPYAASGKYIKRMSNFCRQCRYNPDKTVGEDACPFNALYWNFLERHRDKLRSNTRLSYAYANWERFKENTKEAIRSQAVSVLERLERNAL